LGDRMCRARIELCQRISLGGCERLASPKTTKAGVAEHPEAFNHVGLLVNEPRQSRVALHLVAFLGVIPGSHCGEDSSALPWVAVALPFSEFAAVQF